MKLPALSLLLFAAACKKEEPSTDCNTETFVVSDASEPIDGLTNTPEDTLQAILGTWTGSIDYAKTSDDLNIAFSLTTSPTAAIGDMRSCNGLNAPMHLSITSTGQTFRAEIDATVIAPEIGTPSLTTSVPDNSFDNSVEPETPGATLELLFDGTSMTLAASSDGVQFGTGTLSRF